MERLALQIVGNLQQAGFEAYFVGGCVRDRLLGREPKDFDIATSARPGQIEALFPRTLPIGRHFGVEIVLLEGQQFQVATFRADGDYEDGRHPESVRFCAAQEDAARRDFTVNGLFYDPIAKTLHDWVGGRKDLEARLVRAIGNPEVRFTEDHLRILRAARFAAQLGFEIEPQTAASARTLAPRVASVSAERIAEELRRLFLPPHAARGLDWLQALGLLEVVLPELAATVGCEQSPQWHPEGTVFQHIRRMLELLPLASEPLLPWAVLMHDIAKPRTASRDADGGEIHFYGHEHVGTEMAGVILARLRFPKKETETVQSCVRYHMQFKDVVQMRQSTLKRLLARPTFPLELELHRLDCLGSHQRLDYFDFLVAKRDAEPEAAILPPPLLNGKDLIRLGLAPGPALGAMLAQIQEKQLQDELTTRDQAIEYARQRIDRV